MSLAEIILLLSSTTSSGLILLAGLLHLRGPGFEASKEVATPGEVAEDFSSESVFPPSDVSRPLSAISGANQRLIRLLIEREILSYAITRIYEAESEGKISEDEREQMIRQYEFQLREINKEVSSIEKYARLEQLERERTELLGTMSGRVREIEGEIERIKRETGLVEKPKEELPAEEEKAEKEKKVKKRTRVDLETIMEEVAEAMREMEKIEREEE
ncbi:MAG: hypothetical protein GTN80_05680 [Nitrososphaeria archaeon]|nr:hypothetical protein [Nitrososphaeria archaeon]NIN52639.1 hypothetical protein [Nitrososphaeria archaeon]NIQ33114.1 hypothetical protein [Nitrososphaeria archaeon]